MILVTATLVYVLREMSFPKKKLLYIPFPKKYVQTLQKETGQILVGADVQQIMRVH